MGRPGRKRRLVFEDEYWKLMAAGVGTVEACRRLGIGRTTGYHWRSQRGGLARTVRAEDSRSGRFLSLLERERIASCGRKGAPCGRWHAGWGGPASTISRELQRNMRAADEVSMTRDSLMPAPASTRAGCVAESLRATRRCG